MELSRERMIYSVTNGRKGTAMMAHKGRLSKEEISAIVDYVRATFMRTPVNTPETGLPPQVKLGEAIYVQNCSVCHGDKGNTAFWAKNGLNPPPRDFTGDEARAILTRKRMITSVTHGRPGTGMMPFNKRLSASDIEAVVSFIRYKFMGISPEHDTGQVANQQKQALQEAQPSKAAPEMTAAASPAMGIPGIDAPLGTPQQSAEPAMGQGHAIEVDMAAPMPNGLKGDPHWGRDFYMKNCFTCHGVKGDGNGPRAYFNIPRPRNFTSEASRTVLNRTRIFNSVTNGRVGTVMPAWGKVLTEQQVANVAEFVFRAFIQAETPAGIDEKKKAN